MVDVKLKICSKCKVNKTIIEFSKNKRKGDGLQTFCKECSKNKSKEFYERNKISQCLQILRRKRERRIKAKKYILAYLQAHKCIDCNESDPVVLEFDHLSDKKRNISEMISQGYAVESIIIEIEKCVVRCANCHRRKTGIDQLWYKA